MRPHLGRGKEKKVWTPGGPGPLRAEKGFFRHDKKGGTTPGTKGREVGLPKRWKEENTVYETGHVFRREKVSYVYFKKGRGAD